MNQVLVGVDTGMDVPRGSNVLVTGRWHTTTHWFPNLLPPFDWTFTCKTTTPDLDGYGTLDYRHLLFPGS